MKFRTWRWVGAGWALQRSEAALPAVNGMDTRSWGYLPHRQEMRGKRWYIVKRMGSWQSHIGNRQGWHVGCREVIWMRMRKESGELATACWWFAFTLLHQRSAGAASYEKYIKKNGRLSKSIKKNGRLLTPPWIPVQTVVGSHGIHGMEEVSYLLLRTLFYVPVLKRISPYIPL